MLDFNKLRAAAVQESMDSKTPQDIFNQLTQDKYSYLRSYQSEVLTEWYNNRANQYNLIKMNTGAGKTLVGLLILLTLNHEHRGKMLYVVPDKYLETQVKKEAQKLRIEIAIDENDRAYLSPCPFGLCVWIPAMQPKMSMVLSANLVRLFGVVVVPEPVNRIQWLQSKAKAEIQP